MALLWKHAAENGDVTEADHANLTQLHETGGFSYSPYHPAPPKESYVYSYAPDAFPGVKVNDSTHRLSDITAEDLAEHRRGIEGFLPEENHYQGAWADGDKVHLDLSYADPDHKTVYEAAKRNNQLSYYHMGTGVTYWVHPELDPKYQKGTEEYDPTHEDHTTDPKYQHRRDWRKAAKEESRRRHPGYRGSKNENPMGPHKNRWGQLVDGKGNASAVDGVDRCGCGSKNWDNDRCSGCNKKWDVTTTWNNRTLSSLRMAGLEPEFIEPGSTADRLLRQINPEPKPEPKGYATREFMTSGRPRDPKVVERQNMRDAMRPTLDKHGVAWPTLMEHLHSIMPDEGRQNKIRWAHQVLTHRPEVFDAIVAGLVSKKKNKNNSNLTSESSSNVDDSRPNPDCWHCRMDAHKVGDHSDLYVPECWGCQNDTHRAGEHEAAMDTGCFMCLMNNHHSNNHEDLSQEDCPNCEGDTHRRDKHEKKETLVPGCVNCEKYEHWRSHDEDPDPNCPDCINHGHVEGQHGIPVSSFTRRESE